MERLKTVVYSTLAACVVEHRMPLAVLVFSPLSSLLSPRCSILMTYDDPSRVESRGGILGPIFYHWGQIGQYSQLGPKMPRLPRPNLWGADQAPDHTSPEPTNPPEARLDPIDH